jgi:hypothetical protein
MEPPVLSRGERVIYAVLIALMLTGLILNTLGAWLGIHLQLLAIPCLIAPAMFAATSAVRHLKDDAVVRRFVKDNPTLPKNVHFDVESRVAIITTLDGQMSTLEIPEEVVEAGPHAVSDYLFAELGA